MKKLISCALAVILLLTGAFYTVSCTRTELYSEGNGELNVLCTIFAPFDFARNIGGDKVTVTILQDSGADLHNYTVTSATLEALSAADVFIYIGGVSDEAWVESAIEASGNKDLIAVCLMDHIEPMHAELENDWSDCSHEAENSHESDENHDEDHENHEHHVDEHIWNSIKNVKLMCEAIRAAFVRADSENSLFYNENYGKYLSKLDELDNGFAETVANADKQILVFADRFPFVYLMHDYRISYTAAFSGCSTEVNASFETQIKLINKVNDSNLSCVITIEGNNKDLAKSISSETGCKILELNSMQSVKRADIIGGADYLEIMRQNLAVIKEALS